MFLNNFCVLSGSSIHVYLVLSSCVLIQQASDFTTAGSICGVSSVWSAGRCRLWLFLTHTHDWPLLDSNPGVSHPKMGGCKLFWCIQIGKKVQLGHLFSMHLLSLVKIMCHDISSRGYSGRGLRDWNFFQGVLSSHFLVRSVCRLKTSSPSKL